MMVGWSDTVGNETVIIFILLEKHGKGKDEQGKDQKKNYSKTYRQIFSN